MKTNLYPKGLWIVFLCSAAVLIFLFKPDNGCITPELSAKLYHEAVVFEQANKIQDAYQRYNVVSEQGCRSPERINAGQRASHLTKAIVKASDDTVTALEEYRKLNGKYPASLEGVRDKIPAESMAAFNGFVYHRESDQKMGVVTGLYGSATFSLRK